MAILPLSDAGWLHGVAVLLHDEAAIDLPTDGTVASETDWLSAICMELDQEHNDPKSGHSMM